MAASFPKVVIKIVGTLAALETKNIDALSFGVFVQLHYIVNVSNSGNTKAMTASVKIHRLNGGVEFDVYSKYGNAKIDLNPQVVGSNFVFEFVNREPEVMTVTLARTLI